MKRTIRSLGTVFIAAGCIAGLGACVKTIGDGLPGGVQAVPAGPDLQPGSPKVPVTVDSQEVDGARVAQANIILNQSRRNYIEQWSQSSFEEFEQQVPREAGTGWYVVNGDVVLSDVKHLREFFESRIQAESDTAELILATNNGERSAWSAAQKDNLTYCVSDSFGTRKALVVSAMEAAAGAWEARAAVNFIHDSAQDANCTAGNGQVLFDVRPTSGQPYLARAFFPHDGRSARNVLIDSTSFGLPSGEALSLIGILRHELGHTLGFRHEHTRPEAGTCFEDEQWEPLSSYDPFSVMHYPQCNGQADWSLELTDTDGVAVACLYGPAAGTGPISDLNCGDIVPVVPPVVVADCGPATTQHAGSIARNESIVLDAFNVAPGTALSVVMSGSGDPDLYVAFDAVPSIADNTFACRPFLSGANEICDLVVPENVSTAHVMVHGFAAGTWQLEVTHTGVSN